MLRATQWGGKGCSLQRITWEEQQNSRQSTGEGHADRKGVKHPDPRSLTGRDRLGAVAHRPVRVLFDGGAFMGCWESVGSLSPGRQLYLRGVVHQAPVVCVPWLSPQGDWCGPSGVQRRVGLGGGLWWWGGGRGADCVCFAAFVLPAFNSAGHVLLKPVWGEPRRPLWWRGQEQSLSEQGRVDWAQPWSLRGPRQLWPWLPGDVL